MAGLGQFFDSSGYRRLFYTQMLCNIYAPNTVVLFLEYKDSLQIILHC